MYKNCRFKTLTMELFSCIRFWCHFSILFALTQGITTCDNTKYLEDNDDADIMSTLQKGRTRRTIWLDKKRRLILPPDTSLSVTPILAFPLFKQSSNWVAFENLQIQWTFLILFQGLGWTSDDNAWPLDLSFLLPNMTDSEEDDSQRNRKGWSSSICNHKHRNKLHYNNQGCGRSIPVMALPVYTPGGERATLFPRIEKFLTSFGVNGQACLKRAVCEVHEIPLKYGFGMLGEVLTLLLSASQSTFAKSHLPGYLNAERAGKYGDCSKYYRKCPYSIFTSK